MSRLTNFKKSVREGRSGLQVPAADVVSAAVPYGLALAVCAPAIAYGGNVSLVECLSALVLCLAAGGLALMPTSASIIADRRMQAALAATTLLALWPMVQLLPYTALADPRAQWTAISPFLSQPAPFTATLAIDETWRAAPVALATWGAFWVGVQAFGNRARQKLLWVAVLTSVIGNCAYGLGIFASGRNEVLGVKREGWIEDVAGGIVSGTFINRNHFGLLCCIGLALALTMMTRQREASATSVRQKLKGLYDRWPVFVLAPISLVLLVSIFLSQSRGAMLTAIVVIAAATLLRLKRRAWAVAAIVLLVVLVPVVYQATVVTDFARARVETGLVTSAASRFEVQTQTMRAIVANRGIGIGAGGFEAVFPLYRDAIPDSAGIWNAAHGSYVEWPFTYGVAWTMLLAATVTWLIWTILTVRNRTGAANSDFASLLLLACLLHISYDFGLQTLGLTVIVAALGGSSFGRAVAARYRSSYRSTKAAEPARAVVVS